MRPCLSAGVPSSVVSSPGSGSCMADALQWTQESRHALVVSQKTMIGFSEKGLFGLSRLLPTIETAGLESKVDHAKCFQDDGAKALYQIVRIVQRFAPCQPHPVLLCPSSALDIYVVEYLQVVRDETYRRDEEIPLPLVHQSLQVFQDVRPQPGLTRVARALEREAPSRPSRPLLRPTRRSRGVGTCMGRPARESAREGCGQRRRESSLRGEFSEPL